MSQKIKSIAIGCAAIALVVIAVLWWFRPVVQPTFYYWRTVFELSDNEKELLASQNVDELFVRFFDVDYDAASQTTQPVGTIRFNKRSAKGYRIVPVVFITNRVFKQMAPSQINVLANHVIDLIGDIGKRNKLTINEVQMDCDWSETTRNAYFAFLKALKKPAADNGWQISATVRLHQIKYYSKTGVPPISKGMLMFYNMGSLSDTGTVNSIYNSRDASKYTASINDYPLPLDVALPVFSWAVHQRSGKTVGLINYITRADLQSLNWLRELQPLVFEVVDARFFQGRYFKAGDRLRVETVTPALAKEAASLLATNMRKQSRRVAVFRLDSLTMLPYEKEDFKTIFDCFR